MLSEHQSYRVDAAESLWCNIVYDDEPGRGRGRCSGRWMVEVDFSVMGKGMERRQSEGGTAMKGTVTTRILGDIRADPAKELLLKNSGVFLREVFRQR